MTDKWDSMSGCSWSRANRLYLTPVTAPVSPSQPCQIRGTCAGSPPQAIDSHTLPWGSCQEAKEAAAEGGFPISAVAPTPCALHGTVLGFPTKPQFVCKQTTQESQGMLEALCPGSWQGGRGWHGATHLCLLPQDEHHPLLPDGISSFPLGSALFVGLCSNQIFAELQLSHSGA